MGYTKLVGTANTLKEMGVIDSITHTRVVDAAMQLARVMNERSREIPAPNLRIVDNRLALEWDTVDVTLYITDLGVEVVSSPNYHTYLYGFEKENVLWIPIAETVLRTFISDQKKTRKEYRDTAAYAKSGEIFGTVRHSGLIPTETGQEGSSLTRRYYWDAGRMRYTIRVTYSGYELVKYNRSSSLVETSRYNFPTDVLSALVSEFSRTIEREENAKTW